ncbi:STM4015 family protein [Planotetraspora phitsanulokensis]|uniref:Leucine-rich repeat domain-containing protein n=1 Tax=Planotetraspora phitsanulokensis TaxID=575192 RepID=A0A8J3XMY3_9ACTN|nr:STM4015 family protein [Planotetraspora phitsanulokensis]GII42198.1 hypothetical protein Pph01_72010 [Planotetraspora phitsanulokensis]
MADHDNPRRNVHDYRDRYADLPVAEFTGEGDPGKLPEAGSVAWRLSAEPYDADEGAFAALFARFMEQVDTSAVRAIVVGGWENPYEEGSEAAIRPLTDNAARFPALRALFVGALQSEECEISWIQQSDVTPLLEAFPGLEQLEVRGGTELAFTPVRHDALRTLRFESGGLPAAVVRAVGQCDLPALEELDLWLGVENYGGDSAVADLDAIMSGERLPALRHLGLQDSEIQDEIAAAVASAPVVARLETLSLSMGTLTDLGAEALLTGQPLTHLRELDLHHHFLTGSMIKRIQEALPGVQVDLSEPEDEEDEWRYVAVGE